MQSHTEEEVNTAKWELMDQIGEMKDKNKNKSQKYFFRRKTVNSQSIFTLSTLYSFSKIDLM